MPNTRPHTDINLQEVNTRNESARHIIAGFATAMPALTDIWQYLHDALLDALLLAGEITRLSAELQQARLDRANLLAAMRSALAAHAEGETDPMWYLRDELLALHASPGAPQTAPAASRRRP
jgi:hypothetical protein